MGKRMGGEMLDALFKSWRTKNEAYFNSIVDEFKDTEGKSCVDGDATIWTTRPTSAPLAQLAVMAENGPCSLEGDIVKMLYANANCLTWFNNTSEKWAQAAGNQGRTDISSVLVGNVLNAPHRRERPLSCWIHAGGATQHL